MVGDIFYSDGLRFTCTQCSRCCRHDSGYVFLSQQDLTILSEGLELPEDQVIAMYCTDFNSGMGKQISLREKSNKDCIFWKDGGCSVYAFRPVQCRTYPFWSHILENEEAWQREGRECPGIGVGTLHSYIDIRNKIAARVRNRSLRRE